VRCVGARYSTLQHRSDLIRDWAHGSSLFLFSVWGDLLWSSSLSPSVALRAPITVFKLSSWNRRGRRVLTFDCCKVLLLFARLLALVTERNERIFFSHELGSSELGDASSTPPARYTTLDAEDSSQSQCAIAPKRPTHLGPC